MARICTKCGLPLEDDAKFCAGCGETAEDDLLASQPLSSATTTVEPLPDDDPVSLTDDPVSLTEIVAETDEHEEKRRFFHLKERKYGDTEQFDGTFDSPAERDAAIADLTTRVNGAIYLSVFAAILSVIAIVMVIIFSVMPKDSKNASASEETTAAETYAPPEPTAPPIQGSFDLVQVKGENIIFVKLMEWRLKDSRLDLEADYTGTLSYRNTSEDIAFDTDNNTVKFLGVDCAYTFDGRSISIYYSGDMTLIYQKAV